MKNPVTITLAADDLEPFLRDAAEKAAKYSAWLDHLSPRVGNLPVDFRTIQSGDAQKLWREKFLHAKRIVESFGVEYEQTSEEETLGVEYPYEGGKRKVVKTQIGNFGFVVGSKPNYKKPYPSYRGGIHAEACRQAADRVVRRWREAMPN